MPRFMLSPGYLGCDTIRCTSTTHELLLLRLRQFVRRRQGLYRLDLGYGGKACKVVGSCGGEHILRQRNALLRYTWVRHAGRECEQRCA
jgi:hypothetical protein